MKSAQDKRVSDTSQSDSLDIGTVATLSTMVESQNDLKTISAERRSRYSMNYQSYEATRIQPGEQTRRMLDYMFPGYQKRDPRNWYEMQTQTDLGWYEVPSLIGTELIEGEPIEAYEDKIKSLDLGDDLSDYEGPTEKKSAIKKSHRSSVISKIWEGPPIKMSGKSSQEGFHLDVDDFYHEPQTILVPRDVIEHQELKMDIVPDDQGVPKVVIYLGDKDPSEVNISEKPESTVILFDGKEEFDRTSSGSEGEEEALVPEESKTAEPEPVTSSEDNIDTTDDIVAKDSMEVVPPSVVRIELKSDTDISVSKTEESSSKLLQPDERALQETENSIFLEPIPYSGSHEDVYEDVIPLEPIPPPKEPSPPPKEPTSPPKEITPPPREITPPPREITPPPREITPPPREITPPPREITPPSREITPPPREITPPPPPKEPTPPPKEPSPPPKKPSPPPKEPSPLVESPIPSPVPSIASAIEETPSPPPVTASIPSQTNSHVGSPPDRLFGPLENYPNDLEEESDKMVHSPPRQLPSPSKDESDDHPLKVTDDYPPYYSPPPREASEVSNWLEANILSEAKNLAAKSPKDSSPQKLTIIEPQLSTPILESSVEGSKISSTELEPKGSKAKTKGAMFRDDERLSNPRALEERFSIYYPPPKPKKKKVPALEIETVVPKTDDTLEEKAVNEWVDEEILTPAAVDNWVDKKILSKSKGPPSEKPIFPKTSSQTVVSPESADSDEERVDAWMEDEILKPAQVDNWVANKIMKPADKLSEGKAVSPLLSISSPQAPASSPQIPSSQAIGLHGPSFRSISSTTSRKSDASSPRISELPPSTVAPLPLIPPQPAPSPKDQRESSGRSIDVDERDVDSWITNELLEPAQVGAWIDKEIVQPAHSQKLVDDEQMKQAQVDAWIEKEIVQPAHSQKLVDQQIKPESVQRYVEEDIVKLVSVQPYADEKIMKPSPVKSFYGDEIIEPAKPQPYVGEDNVKPAADSREGTIIKSASPLEQPSPQRSPPSEEYSSKFAFKFPVSDDNMPAVAEPPSKTETPIVIPDENISTELPYDFKYLPEKQSPVEDSRVVEPTKKFQSPETYLSDMDLLGPFLPHPDHPDEYPQKMTEEMPTPLSQPKPMEGKQETYASRTPVKEKSEMNALQIPSRQPETSVEPVKLMPGTAISETPVKEKSETSSMKLPKHLPVEKTPTESLPISVTSLGRKPSLKQKSDSGSLSKMKQSGIEPEKKDRPSILAKKAIEADNYLLRDEDHDYVLPKMSSGTQLPEEKRRKSSDSKKLCPLTNLFKRKRSSQDSQGFKPSSFIKRESAEDDDKGKHQAKQLSSIDEEDFIIPPKGASIRPSSTGKKPDEDLSKRNVAPSSPKAKPVDSSDPEGISVTTKSIVDYPPFVPSISIISKTPDSTPQISEVPSSAKTIPPSTIQSTVEPPGQKTVPKHAQAKSESIPHLHTPKDGLAKFPKESPLVAPEELFDAFPEFPDRDELLKNRKKPRKDEVKALPNPPKSGFPMFPDYRQLIDPQIETQLTDVSSSKENPEVGLFSETNEDMEHQGDDEGESPMDRNSTASSEKILDPHSVPQVTVKSEEALKIKEKSIKKSDEFKNISVTLTDESRKEPSIPQVAPPKDSVGYIQDSNEPESTKHDVTTEKRCWSTEPTPPGDGVPKFSDYHEMTIGPDNILPKPQNEPTPWVHQIPASFSDGSPRSQQIAVAQELTSQQQPATQPSRSQGPNAPHSMQIPSTTPPIFEQQPHITPEIEPQEYRPNQLLQIPQTQQQPYAPNEKAYIKPYEEQASQTQLMQAPSFKKYDYSQPEKPVQRMSVPMGQQILNSGERGGLQSQPEYYGQSPSQTQKNMLADGSVPLPQQNISPYGGSVGTPTYTMPPLQIKPEWRRPYHSTPQQQPSTFPEGYVSVKQRAPQQSPGSPNGQIQQQAPGIPYGKVSQTQQTHPSADSPLAPQGPIQQQFAYEKPTSSYRAPPSAGKLPPPSFSQYGPVRNQDPYSGPPTSPYSKPYQYTTNQPVAPPYSGYGPFQQTPYGGPATRPYSTAPGSVQPQLPYSAPTTSSYKPGTEKLRNAPDFSPYNQIPQQAPTDKSIKYKKPEIQKHTYTHPEKPLPLAPVRPRGIEDKDLSPEKGSPKTSATAGLDHGPIFERQTTPIEPGGGVPRFPDYEPVSEPTLKAPTMTGDFRKTPQKPKMVTAADKRAEFDMEIQPIMQQIQDLKRQMYELTPQKGPPIRTGPEHGRPLPSSMQLYNELEKRTLAATKSDREGARAERRKQQYEANVRRKIEREIERSRQSK